jgi:hypothetical protein
MLNLVQRTYTDKAGYEHVVWLPDYVQDDFTGGIPVSVDIQALGLSVAIQKTLWDKGIIFVSDWISKPVFTTIYAIFRGEHPELTEREAKLALLNLIETVRATANNG